MHPFFGSGSSERAPKIGFTVLTFTGNTIQKKEMRQYIMKLQDFLKPELLGNKFIAVKGYSEILDRETQKITAYRLNVSIQSENSDFYMEMIPVKINNLTPTVSVQELKENKVRPIQLENLNVGQFNGALWFNATDVLPVKQQ